jgi:RHS repeat-associated protein
MAALGRTSDPGVHVDYAYTDKSEVDSSAKYVLTSNWLVGSLLAGTGRDFEYDPIGNRDATYGYAANALDQYTAAPGLGSFSYDGNGNMTGDGVRTYAYDGENRLIGVTQGPSSWTYVYDYLGRRIQKSGTGISTTRFLYDGWNLIAELDASGNILRRFAWGPDVSGTLAGAGGVGGLLLVDAGAAQYWPVYDASHNVIALYSSGGGFAAAYEYDPFGNLQNAQGGYAASNPFRHSTKYADSETSAGLVYYGMRYYSPQLGRFINRDPLEEGGGIDLYGFCGNDSVNKYDYLGCDDPDDEVRAAAEDNARRGIIDKYGVMFYMSGLGDDYMIQCGDAASAGTTAAVSDSPQSIINEHAPELRGKLRAEISLGYWDRAAKDAILYLKATNLHSGISDGFDESITDSTIAPNSSLYASTDDTMALRALASRMGPTLGDMRFKEAAIGVSSWILGTPGKFDDGAAAIVDFAGAMDNPLSPYSLSQGLPSNIFSKALADRIDVAWEAVDRTGGALSNGAGDVAQNFLQSYKNLMNRADGPFQAYTVVQTQTYTRVSSFFGLFHSSEWVDGPRTYTPVNTGPLGGFFVTPSAAASAARAALIQQLYNGRF